MALDSKHPLFSEFLEDWSLCRDSYRGERIVKMRGQTYLPATPGQLADGMANAEDIGMKSYVGYKTRAVFPDAMSEAIDLPFSTSNMELSAGPALTLHCTWLRYPILISRSITPLAISTANILKPSFGLPFQPYHSAIRNTSPRTVEYHLPSAP